MLLEHGATVLASDIDHQMLDGLGNLKNEFSSCLELCYIDLNDATTIKHCLEFKPDTILCFNVLEHVELDKEALSALFSDALVGTKLLLIVPAHALLYGFMDREAGHFRRYQRAKLSGLLEHSGWVIKDCRYINPVGALGWLLQNRLIRPRRAVLDDPGLNRNIAFFDRYLVPVTEALDPITASLFGQSILAIGERR
jgi:hypothetical protein